MLQVSISQSDWLLRRLSGHVIFVGFSSYMYSAILFELELSNKFTMYFIGITEGPVSVTALIGTNAQFHCAGAGNYLVWDVDGPPLNHPDIMGHGITFVTQSSSGTVQSNLTVQATSVNNGTTVRCAIGVSQLSFIAISNYSTLTVLPGE